MRWTWPFNGRAANGQRKNGNGSGAHRTRPDFLCVGAQKGGTTWLYWQLDSHPDFWMPPVKELHYFDKLSRTNRVSRPRRRDRRDVRFLESIKSLSARSCMDLEHYGRLFQPKGPLLSGDVTPAYSTLDEEIIRQITSYFPNLKVIFLARDPVERAWSQLSMEVRRGWISPFDVTDIDDVDRNLLHQRVLSRSHPSKIVAQWKRYVHPDRFRTYFFDDLQTNPTELRHRILHFLGANPEKRSQRLPPDYNADADQKKLPLTDKVRSHLAQFFKNELTTCAARLGGAARNWPARYGFSVLVFLWDLLDDSIDLLFWCDWIG
jgi:hypothetical protein